VVASGDQNVRGESPSAAPSPTLPTDPRDLHTLLTLAAAGEGEAVDELLAVVHPRARRYSRALFSRTGGEHRVADGVAQEICIALLLALRHYQGADVPAELFVYRIAAQKAAIAAGKIEPSTRDDQLPARSILDRLPQPQRELIVLRVAVGLTVQQAGLVLQQTLGAVRFNQHRAVQRLRGPAGPNAPRSPLDLAQIRAVDALLDRLVAVGPALAARDAAERDRPWLAAMVDLLAELDEQPDVTERLHQVLAGRPLWSMDTTEHAPGTDLEENIFLHSLLPPQAPAGPAERFARWTAQYLPAVSAVAVVVLVVGGLNAAFTRDPLRPVDGVRDVVAGLAAADDPTATTEQARTTTVVTEVSDTISAARAAVDLGDEQRAQRLLGEAKRRVVVVQPEKARPLLARIAALEAEVGTPSPSTSPTAGPEPSASSTPEPTATPTPSTSSPEPTPTSSPSTSDPSTSPPPSAATAVTAPGTGGGSASTG
jgi:RNA polymerase sigma-70 factor (ECF subfamily)